MEQRSNQCMTDEHYHFYIGEFPKFIVHATQNSMVGSWASILHKYGYTNTQQLPSWRGLSMPVKEYTMFVLRWA